ncbi:hypothetical protein ILUMI_19747, partial [Ignelater luminosus]
AVNDEDDMTITMKELTKSLQKLKVGNASGHDEMTAEMLNYMGDKGTKIFLQLLNKITRDNKIAEDWELAVILPIHKKVCNNYRGISLLNTARKIHQSILTEKPENKTESKLIEKQNGFKTGSATTDGVFVIKQLVERTIDTGEELSMCFIDTNSVH